MIKHQFSVTYDGPVPPESSRGKNLDGTGAPESPPTAFPPQFLRLGPRLRTSFCARRSVLRPRPAFDDRSEARDMLREARRTRRPSKKTASRAGRRRAKKPPAGPPAVLAGAP